MVQLKTPQPQRHPNPTTKAQQLGYLLFEMPDLEKAGQYLRDFGLAPVRHDANALYMRGTQASPFCYRAQQADIARFVGFGLIMGRRSDLEALTALPGASSIEYLDYPGGGECVRLHDPSGFLVEAVYGQSPVDTLPHRKALELNYDLKTPRINVTQRPPQAPPEVLKLGHVVIEVADFQATCNWYTTHFGFIPSDVQVLPDGSPAVAFLRLDLGERPADHHTLAMAQGFMPQFSHSAFELVDTDAIGMGQRILRERGWKHAWGIGRHILGSQIFDYWNDPWGHKLEHYCDGDVFSSDSPMGVHSVSREAMSQWGQIMPVSFTKPKINLTTLKSVFYHLKHSPDLTVRKLITLAKLFS